MDILFATSNKNKLIEVKKIMENTSFNIISLEEAKIFVDVEETGETFAENAILKANEIAKLSGLPTLADDSGIEIDFLNGEPGVKSARFLGVETDYNYKNKYILDKMKNAKGEERNARFVCAIAFSHPKYSFYNFVEIGTIEGQIAKEQKGDGGFGYDPIFFYPPLKVTTSEMTPKQKNELSHRGKALKKATKRLAEFLEKLEG